MGDLIDLTDVIEDVFSMPLCPLCGQPLESEEDIEPFRAHGCLALAHTYCLDEAVKERDNEK